MSLRAFALLTGFALGSIPAGADNQADFDARIRGLAELCRHSLAGDAEQALSTCRRTSFDLEKLAPGSAPHIDTLVALGDLKQKTLNFPSADAYYDQALVYLDRSDRNGRETARVLELQGQCKISRGKPGDAERLLQRALSIREARSGPDSIETARTRVMDADALSLMAQYPAAERQFRRAIESLEQKGGAARSETLRAQRRLAELMERQSRFPQARAEYTRLLEAARQPPAVGEATVVALDRLAWMAAQEGHVDEAVDLYQQELAAIHAAAGSADAAAAIEARIAELKPAGTPR